MTRSQTPTGSDQSPATPTGAAIPAQVTDPATSSPGDQQPAGVNDAVKARLARQERKHQVDLAAAQDQAVVKFKAEHGITDETLAELGSGKFAGMYKRISELEAELGTHRQQATERAEKHRVETVSAAILHSAEKLNLPILEGARDMVLRDLGETLDVDDSGMVIVKAGDADHDFEPYLKSYLQQRPFLVAPNSIAGGGSRPSPERAGPLETRKVDSTDRRRAMAAGLLR